MLKPLALVLALLSGPALASEQSPCEFLAVLAEATLRDRNLGGSRADTEVIVAGTTMPFELKAEALRMIGWLWTDPDINTLPPATAGALVLINCRRSPKWGDR